MIPIKEEIYGLKSYKKKSFDWWRGLKMSTQLILYVLLIRQICWTSSGRHITKSREFIYLRKKRNFCPFWIRKCLTRTHEHLIVCRIKWMSQFTLSIKVKKSTTWDDSRAQSFEPPHDTFSYHELISSSHVHHIQFYYRFYVSSLLPRKEAWMKILKKFCPFKSFAWLLNFSFSCTFWFAFAFNLVGM